jgi:nucleoside-diphosphate-sugar epimerase
MAYLVTGGAGFIGSNIVEHLLRKGEKVRVLDNFSTGRRDNLLFDVSHTVEVIEGDIRDVETCRNAVRGADYVIHQAALASVPKSVEDPLVANDINATGTLNLLVASRDAGVKRLIYASSSSIYGDEADSGENAETVAANAESMKPNPLSPYAASKLTGEYYCGLFSRLYGFETVSLRYFNVFGRRQDPASEYAAVIPKFIQALLENRSPVIYGDGQQTRDFTHVDDIVKANLGACFARREALGRAFNIACGRRYSLLDLLRELQAITGKRLEPNFADARKGDVRHSMADITLARTILGFTPETSFREGLEKTVQWYKNNLGDRG